MNRKEFFRTLGVIGLLLGLVLFLTGCFDMYQEIWISSKLEESRMKIILTTRSEEVFEMLKASMTAEVEEGEAKFEIIEPETPEGETKYRINVEAPLEEDVVSVSPYNGGLAYEFSLLSEEEEEEVSEEFAPLFEGYKYQLLVHFPEPITETWWGRIDAEDKKPLDPQYIQGTDFSLELDMLTAFSPDSSHVTITTGANPE